MTTCEKLRKRRTKKVSVEYDGDLYEFTVTSLNAREYFEIISVSQFDGQVSPEFVARYVAYSIVDDVGERPYANEKGVCEVLEWPVSVVNELFKHAKELTEAEKK